MTVKINHRFELMFIVFRLAYYIQVLISYVISKSCFTC